MKSEYYLLKSKVIELRKSGKTYGEIVKVINKNIPKSTLSDWCHNIYLLFLLSSILCMVCFYLSLQVLKPHTHKESAF